MRSPAPAVVAGVLALAASACIQPAHGLDPHLSVISESDAGKIDGGLDASRPDSGTGDGGDGGACGYSLEYLPGIPVAMNDFGVVALTLFANNGLTPLAATWTKTGGIETVIGILADGGARSTTAVAITDNGCVIGNTSLFYESGAASFEPFAWCPDAGVERILGSSNPGDSPRATSGSDVIVAGEVQDRPVRWRVMAPMASMEFISNSNGIALGTDRRESAFGHIVSSGGSTPFAYGDAGMLTLQSGAGFASALFGLGDESIGGLCGSVACVWNNRSSPATPAALEFGFSRADLVNANGAVVTGSQWNAAPHASVWPSGPKSMPQHWSSWPVDGGEVALQTFVGARQDLSEVAGIGLSTDGGTAFGFILRRGPCEK